MTKGLGTIGTMQRNQRSLSRSSSSGKSVLFRELSNTDIPSTPGDSRNFGRERLLGKERKQGWVRYINMFLLSDLNKAYIMLWWASDVLVWISTIYSNFDVIYIHLKSWNYIEKIATFFKGQILKLVWNWYTTFFKGQILKLVWNWYTVTHAEIYIIMVFFF